MNIRILTAVAAVVLAGCQAQEGVPQAAVLPGLPPTAIPDVVVVQTDSTNNPINALANDIDLSGTGLTITAVAVDQTLPPLAGAVATTNGATVTFTPPATFVGVVTLLYDIADGDGGVSSGAIAVSVLPVALPPVAVPDAAVITQDSGANDIDVLANDVDLSGGGLTLTSATIAQSLPPATHAVALAANEVRFTPAAAFVGVVVVNYVATDANGETANGVLTVVVSPLALPPLGPIAVPDAATVAQNSGATNISVLTNDVSPTLAALSLTGVSVMNSVPAGASTAVMNGNQVQFTPAAGFTGVVLVSYTVTDGTNSANGVLTVVVTPLALPPVGPIPVPDLEAVAQDSGATDIDVLANDVNTAGSGVLTLSGVTVMTSVPSVPPGSHTALDVGDQVRFTPLAGFAGTVVVSYTATDINGNSANGVLTVVVSPLAPPGVGPIPIPDVETVAQDSGPTVIDVLANDVNTAGSGVLTLSGVTVLTSVPSVPPGSHTALDVGDQVQFTPAAGFAGLVVVTYTATDINGLSLDGVLTITVTPTPLTIPPLALPDIGNATSSGGAQSFNVLGNDVDPAAGGLTLTMTSITLAAPALNSGAVAIVGNQVQYTPVVGYVGIVTVGYTAQDINGNTTTGTLTLTVTLI